MKYRLCAHKGGIDPEDAGKHPDISGAIKWWSRQNLWNPFGMAKYSHVEIQRGRGDCFSADGYYNVVRHKEIRFSHPDRWDFYDLGTYSTYEDDQIQWRCDQIEGHEYDYWGAFTCPWRGPGNHEKWYCSEAGLYVMGVGPTDQSPDMCVDTLIHYARNRGVR